MSGDKKNIIYTAKDIEAYFSGQLSSSGMHAMEKDALDDPFLAEAMEGYEVMQGKSWKPQLVELHRHFEEERSPAKVIPLNRATGRWWKVAAAILVIGCGATLTYMLTTKRSTGPGKEEIAKTTIPNVVPDENKKTETVAPITTAKTPLTQDHILPSSSGPVTLNNQSTSNGVTTIEDKKITAPSTSGKDIVSSSKLLQPENKPITTAPATGTNKNRDADLASATKPAVPVNNNNQVSPSNNAVAAINEGLRGKALEESVKKKAEQKPATPNNNQAMSHNFLAQVIGPDNTPLPFANITVKNEDFGTYADVKGNFRLVSSDSLVNVEVRSVGYLPRIYTLHSNAPQNRIVLAEDENTAKERAVVINDGTPSNRSARRAGVLKDSLYVNVEPADGWDNYNAYIRNNIAIPENALKKDMHGEVELSFKVHPNGTVTDITVSQSDCADCAELAKRLLQQGPQWKIKKGIRKSSARIKVQF